MNTTTVLVAMLPEHLLLAGIVVLLVADIAARRPRGGFALSLVALTASAAAALTLALDGYSGAPFPGQFSVGPPDLFAKAILLALAVPSLLLARDQTSEGGDMRFHVLLLSSLYGACLMLSADSFLTLFLGLELMSLPVYVLVLFAQTRVRSAEAALKYLVLGGTATATFLMGVSLVFGASGSLSLEAFTDALSAGDPLAATAVILIVAAFFLKAAVAPFHTWAPDAYEGASVPVTAYMATVVKGAVLLAAVRLFADAPVDRPLADLIAILPLASIVWGNLTAMRQDSFRRMIAYSSIAHAGYLFYAFLGDPAGRFEAVAFYVIVYGLMNVLAFAALSLDDASDRLDRLKGLFARSPWAAVMISVAMLSLAGIPPLPGFIAKFLIFKNVIAAGYTAYAVLGLVGSYLGIYFYLRVIQYMFMSEEAPAAAPIASRRLALSAALLCLVPALLLAIFPGWIVGHL